MKRKIYHLVIALLVMGNSSFAQQWTGNNNTTDAISRDGNVGIGTGTNPPTAKLDVNCYNGAGEIPQSGLLLRTSSFNTGTNANNSYYLKTLDMGSGSVPFIIKGNGNVGIGTESPASLLDVQGNTGGNIVTRVKNNGAGRAQLYLDAGGTSDASIQFMTQGTSYFKLLSVNSFFGLYDDVNSTYRLSVNSSGNVGIGTASPSFKLDVNGGSINIPKDEALRAAGNWVLGQTSSNAIHLGSTAVSNDFSFDSNTSTGLMTIKSTGDVAIGTTDSKGYKLAVAGNAIAESMTVKLQANWPDYVFKPSYSLTPLSELKIYIDKNQHLPEVPSAAEVEKDGQNLGEMNKLLLKKVEELTLYLIEQQKINQSLQLQIDKLSKQIKQ